MFLFKSNKEITISDMRSLLIYRYEWRGSLSYVLADQVFSQNRIQTRSALSLVIFPLSKMGKNLVALFIGFRWAFPLLLTLFLFFIAHWKFESFSVTLTSSWSSSCHEVERGVKNYKKCIVTSDTDKQDD